MQSELPRELFATIAGMRKAGATRAAVIEHLVQQGVRLEMAEAEVDRLDAELASRHGARPDDIRPEIAAQVDADRQSNLAATGLEAEIVAPVAAHDEPRPLLPPAVTQPGGHERRHGRFTLGRTAEEKLVSDSHVLLKAGLPPAELKQQWIAAGMTEARADHLLQTARSIDAKAAQRKRTNQRRLEKVLFAALAVALLAGAFGIFRMLQPPSASEQARDVTRAACGTSEARAARFGGEIYLLAGETLATSRSIEAGQEGFDDLYLADGDVRPTQVLCSQVSLLPTELCGPYEEMGLGYDGLPSVPSWVNVQGSRLIVTARDIGSFEQLGQTSEIVVPATCPTVIQTTQFGSAEDIVRRPTIDDGWDAIVQLRNAQS